MEFKGTKGNWTVFNNAKYSDVVRIKSDSGTPTFGENEYNALLIEKALEMLVEIEKDIEFLQNLCNRIEDVAVDDNLWDLESRLNVNEILARIEDKRKLIKQATEL